MNDYNSVFGWMDDVENDGDDITDVRMKTDRDKASEGDEICVEYGDDITNASTVLVGTVDKVEDDPVDGMVIYFTTDDARYYLKRGRIGKWGESGSYPINDALIREEQTDGLIADGGRNGPHPTAQVETDETPAESDTTDYDRKTVMQIDTERLAEDDADVLAQALGRLKSMNNDAQMYDNVRITIEHDWSGDY